MKRLTLVIFVLSSLSLSAHANDRVGRAGEADKRAFDLLLKDMSRDFHGQPAAADPALKQRVNRAQERQNQRKANARERTRDERGRQSPTVTRTPAPTRTR